MNQKNKSSEPIFRFQYDKDFRIIFILFLISGILSWHLYFKEYRQADTVDIAKFPKTIDGWTAEDLPLTEDEYAILETRNVVARKYTNLEKKVVYLLLVYSQHNRKVSHPPEVCYMGSGISIVDNSHETIQVDSQNLKIHANRLLLESKGTKQFTFYWFKVGDTFTSNYWKQQLLIAVKTILGQPHSSALVRISADVEDNNEAEAISQIKNFTRLILKDVVRYLP